ncbi:MAG TPA: MBL fold metallo-hydrolase [Eoetvoesiella sp.]
MKNYKLKARNLLFAVLAAGVSISAWTVPQSASAAVPAKQMTQVPGYYRMMLGDLEVTALYDGAILLDRGLLKGVTEQDLQDLLAQMFVPTSGSGVQTAVNAYLVNTGKNLILMDAGAAKCFGPTLGSVRDNIRAAGYDAAQIDTVLLTHLHGDHACGIATDDGKIAFPNATVYVDKNEAGFWLNKEIAAKAPKDAQPFFEAAQNSVAPYGAAGKLKQFNPGDTVIPGVISVPLPGHTPGHGGYLLSSEGQQLLVWGDVVHSHSVQFMRPEVSIEFDVDQPQAVVSRKKILAEADARKLWVAGAHLPFPGIGHVHKEDKGYTWIPVEYSPVQAKK